MVIKAAAEARSYIVRSGDTTYRRNRRDLLKVEEPHIDDEVIPSIHDPPVETRATEKQKCPEPKQDLSD